MPQECDYLARRLAYAAVLREQLKLDQAYRVAISAAKSADASREDGAPAIASAADLFAASILMHSLRLQHAEHLIDRALARPEASAGIRDEGLHALRLVRFLGGTLVNPRRVFQPSRGDVPAPPLLLLRRYEAVVLSARDPGDLHQFARPALASARSIVVGPGILRRGSETSLLDGIESVYLHRCGQLDEGRLALERAYEVPSPTPLQQIRRAFFVIVELAARGDPDEARNVSQQVGLGCWRLGLAALANRAAELADPPDERAWLRMPLLEVIL